MLLCLVNKKGVCFFYLSFPSFLFLPPPLREARAKRWALGGSSGEIGWWWWGGECFSRELHCLFLNQALSFFFFCLRFL